MRTASYLLPIILFGWLASALHSNGQTFTIDSFDLASDGARQFTFDGQATNYYILYRGEMVTNIATSVRVGFGVEPATLLEDRTELLGASFYRIAAAPTNAPLDLDGDGTDDVAELNAGTDPLIAHSLVINEVDYDQVGAPDTAEFVEIYNPTGNGVNMDALAVVFINGANNQQYLRVNLSGSLASGQYLVIGGTNIINALPVGVIGIGLPDNSIQNGSPDGILLFNHINNGILDALSYEGSITAGVVAGVPATFNLVEGSAESATDSNATDGSLSRIPNGTDSEDADSDWFFSNTPTPGAANVP